MKKVAVWGKFNKLHKGQIEFFRHAKELGDELYVIIIPDEKVRENSGRLPVESVEERRRKIQQNSRKRIKRVIKNF